MCTLALDAAIAVVTDYMPGTEVLPEVVPHRIVRMVDGNLPVLEIPGYLARLEQQFQVHHVVDDDRIVPFPEIPAPDKAYLFVVSGIQRLCRLDYCLL